ncbi:MAG: RNA pseudouridine synthase [Prevotella sp.]|nr:RNA pseudouridine synthase [Prevotella sp.]
MGYVVHPLCQQAAEEVQQYIASVDVWQEEIAKGKMFGVLVVEDGEGKLGFLAAYSGLLADRNDWSYFVPAVFDFQQPDGYFKQEETAISGINQRIKLLEQSSRLRDIRDALRRCEEEREKDIKAWKTAMDDAKARRDAIRQQRRRNTQHEETLPTEEEMTRESQWMKAELRRKRQHHETVLSAIRAEGDALEKEIMELRILRRKKSEALQQWLFEHFRMLNAKGETRDLLSIFADTSLHFPPSGSGECCAPKLLQYAFAHHLRPVCIAEFWWGQSPTGEIRQHHQYYPACRGKCHPILKHMLQGLEVEPNPFEQTIDSVPDIIYEDDVLMVVNKPEGMLSVPGKTSANSVWDFCKNHCPDADGPMIVHRLDMATSGLMVVAKTKSAHQKLQEQFLHHTVEKTYTAQLERPLPPTIPRSGIIRLPLRPSLLDRPRQVVDMTHGKTAITQYEMLTDVLVSLTPLTGRTHQLRVHCAHHDGLATPIKGDTLYGQRAQRLCLHAGRLSFTHPITGGRMDFTSPADFIG